MTVLDAYAVVAYLRGEAMADQVATILRSPSLLAAVNAAEVIDQLVRVFGRDPDDVHADLALLSHAGMQLARLSPEVGTLAGRLRARHYHRRRMRAEGGKVHGLPDSTGRLP